MERSLFVRVNVPAREERIVGFMVVLVVVDSLWELKVGRV